MTTTSIAGRLSINYGTGAAAIAEAVAPGRTCRIVSVLIHLSAAPTAAGNVTVTLNSGGGGAYDTVLNSTSLVGTTDFAWMPNNDLYLSGGDSLDVAYVNTNTLTYGVTTTLEMV